MLSQESIFIGANKQTQVSDLEETTKVVAYGAGKTIALWKSMDASHQGVFKTLKGHTAEVTCVRFVKETDMMVSASEDFEVRVWNFPKLREGHMDEVECIQVIKHHKHTITVFAVLKNLLVVGCADGSISVWSFIEDQYVLQEEFSVQKGVFPLCLSMHEIEKNQIILAIGGTNVNVFIYSLVSNSEGVSKLELATKLEGHEDWIKSLVFRETAPGDYLLASGSQDRYIRLWRIRTNEKIDTSEEDEKKLTLLSNKIYKFDISADVHVAINFEALIMGHDDWISSLQWHKTKLQLLTSTADTAVMVWEPDTISGIWICSSRLGELSSKGASTATGSSGGFWSCIWFTHDGKDVILTNGKTGSWRIWTSTDGLLWDQELGITGATKSVTDVAWSIDGNYLLSTSLDQTTRLFAEWKYETSGVERKTPSWCEMARPQIHGYDMLCVEPISNTRFVSGGDEKILRSFDEPKAVAQLLQKFSGIKTERNGDLPDSAALPALGLSNKATTDVDENESDDDPDARETAETKNISSELIDELLTPPLEDQLQRHTLWPEIEKLYGHGYEISCIDVSPDRKLIATACKSNNAQHAVIRLFDAVNWNQLPQVLPFHNLTITKLRFSKDNRYLLSVSRDRLWSLWERNFDDNSFVLRSHKEKPHSRIIWDADWVPLAKGLAFITASRDKTLKFWRLSKEDEATSVELENSIRFSEPVTSISVHKDLYNEKVLLAVGFESGAIRILSYTESFNDITKIDWAITPADKINRLRWSNLVENGKLLLGVGSADTSTRIYSLNISTFKD
ncbi:Elp2 [Kluyveromyces lactis]|nr:Elp2 [Kluyveromyces lactis]